MSRRPRIAIGGIAHETNTFATSLTTLEDVRQRTLLTDNALLANARGTNLDVCLVRFNGRRHSTSAVHQLSVRITAGVGPFVNSGRRTREIEGRPDVLLAALVPGFSYSDVTESCASVLVTTENDPSLANTLADALAAAWWQVCHDLQTVCGPGRSIRFLPTRRPWKVPLCSPILPTTQEPAR